MRITFKAFFLLTAVSLLFISSTPAQTDNFKPKFLPHITIPKIPGDIKVDGQFSEPLWKKAAIADGFVENDPGDQVKPPVESKALVAYDEDNLYIALIAYDDASTIRTSYSDRDNIFRDDYFGVILDTYGDQSWGYELFVNPYGIQGDLRIESSGNEDMSFDLVWYSEGIVTDSGYQVEIVIPFASLRFPDQDKQNWRINFWRDHQRDLRRRYCWAAQDRDNSCFLCQLGSLDGIAGIKPGKNIELLPSVIGYQSSMRDPFHPDTKLDSQDPDGELSLNGRYGISSNSSLEFTVNPDFSQVESDGDQIDVNTNFGLFFSESRPFFQEGSELYNTWFDGVYTRTINDPIFATKYTAKFGRTSLAMLSARDDASPVTITLESQSSRYLAEKSWCNIFRIKHVIKDDTYVGLLFTDRRRDSYNADTNGNEIYDSPISSGSGSLFGFDSNIRLKKSWNFEFQTIMSYTEESNDNGADLIDTTIDRLNQATFDGGKYTVGLDGEKYWGEGIYASLEHNSRNYSFDIDYWEASPTLRAENGFINQNDYRQLTYNTAYDFRPNGTVVSLWEPQFGMGRRWRHSGTFNPLKYNDAAFDEWFILGGYFRFQMQTNVFLQYTNSRERYFGILLPGISLVNLSLDTRFSKIISGGFDMSIGNSIRRNKINPELGFVQNLSFYLICKPTERLRLDPTFDYSKMDHRDGYLIDHPDADKKIYEGYIFRTRLTYQFTKELFLRLVVQYNDFSERFDIEPLLTYKINPFTKFYIGMTGGYEKFYPDEEELNLDQKWLLKDRQIFAKLQYLFRL